MPAEQDLMNVAYQAAISQRNRYKEQRDKLEAELLAAQERHEEFKRVAMKEAELAQEREKALREALVRLRNCALLVANMRKAGKQPPRAGTELDPQRVFDVAEAALAGSPSEKPDG